MSNMGVGRRGARQGFAPSWILKLITKKFDFSISRGKNQISSLLAVPWKNFGKIPYWPIPAKNPSDTHDVQHIFPRV